MSEETALLRAIIEHPDDDTTRLVYADWLDENGRSERAEFIRGQCQLARMQAWEGGYAELNARCELLLRTHRKSWESPLAEYTAGTPEWMQSVAFHRGFPDRLASWPQHFAGRWQRLLQTSPVRKIEFWWHWERDAPRDFWNCEGLARLRRLWVHRGGTDRFQHYPGAVLRAPRWAVTDLGVPSNLVDDLPPVLADAPFAPHLDRLELVSRGLEPSRWLPLWQATGFARLKRFAFRTRHSLTEALDFGQLASAVWLPRLEWLELAGSGESPPLFVPSLAHLLQVGRLRALTLGACGILQHEVSAFRSLPEVSLESLDLSSARGIGRKVLRAVIQSPGLSRLRSLATSGNGNAALLYLRDAPMRESLRVLRAAGCRPSGLIALARAGCPELASLDLSLYISGREDGSTLLRTVDAILDPERFPRLVSLTLWVGGSPGDLLQRLLENPALTRLRELTLRMHIGADALRAILTAGNLRALFRLQIPEHYLPGHQPDQAERRRAVETLRERFGSRYDPASW